MKQRSPLVFILALLASCSKSTDTGPPSLVGGTWTWSAQDYTTTPKGGAPSRTVHSTQRAYTESFAFEANGVLTIAYDGRPEPQDTYTYAAPTLTFLRPFGTFAFVVKELSAHRLVMASTTEDAVNQFESVDTYVR